MVIQLWMGLFSIAHRRMFASTIETIGYPSDPIDPPISRWGPQARDGSLAPNTRGRSGRSPSDVGRSSDKFHRSPPGASPWGKTGGCYKGLPRKISKKRKKKKKTSNFPWHWLSCRISPPLTCHLQRQKFGQWSFFSRKCSCAVWHHPFNGEKLILIPIQMEHGSSCRRPGMRRSHLSMEGFQGISVHGCRENGPLL